MSRIKKKKSNVRHISISAGQAGQRIDNFLISELKGIPKARIYQMLRKGEVRINSGRVKQDYRLKEEDTLRLPPVTLAPAAVKKPPPANLIALLKRSILYEDDQLIAVNKPCGIAVHGGSGLNFGVINILRHVYRDVPDLQLIHRLDRDTSGILLLARNRNCLVAIQDQLRSGDITKIYQALLVGKMPKSMEVNKPLEKHVERSGERLVDISVTGKNALTRFTLVKNMNSDSLVQANIATGRTHQIRVHAKYIGYPVAGDEKYGDRKENQRLKQLGLKRMFLHASRMEIPDYQGKKGLIIEAPLPEELSGFLARYEQSSDI